MKDFGNIIAIDKLETAPNKAIAAFHEFMTLSQKCYNEHSTLNPKRYANHSAHEIEEDTVQILEEVKPSTAFANSTIELKSGHFFQILLQGNIMGLR